MRGEETQIVGAMALHPPVRSGRQLLVLPGTHTKWVLAAEGAVESFQTSLTGELFALLRDQSSLGRAGPGRNDGAERNGFADGVARQAAAPPAALLHLLFEARSRQLLQDWARDEAMAYLSGVLIGSDVAAGLQQFGGHSAAVLIGEPALTRRYAEALGAHGVQALALEGTACALAGLHAIFPGIDGGKL
jgi:2-dehydro-3-deoxygalactonokinase